MSDKARMWVWNTVSAAAGAILAAGIAWGVTISEVDANTARSKSNAAVLSGQPWRDEIRVALGEHAKTPHEGAVSEEKMEAVIRRLFAEISRESGLYATEGRTRLDALQRQLDRIEKLVEKLNRDR